MAGQVTAQPDIEYLASQRRVNSARRGYQRLSGREESGVLRIPVPFRKVIFQNRFRDGRFSAVQNRLEMGESGNRDQLVDNEGTHTLLNLL